MHGSGATEWSLSWECFVKCMWDFEFLMNYTTSSSCRLGYLYLQHTAKIPLTGSLTDKEEKDMWLGNRTTSKRFCVRKLPWLDRNTVICFVFVFLCEALMYLFSLQTQTDRGNPTHNMSTSAVSQSCKQEREGSFFKVHVTQNNLKYSVLDIMIFT